MGDYEREIAAYAEQAGLPATPEGHRRRAAGPVGGHGAGRRRRLPRQRTRRDRERRAGPEAPACRTRGRRSRRAGTPAEGSAGADRPGRRPGRHRALAELDPPLRPDLGLRRPDRPAAGALSGHRLLLRLQTGPVAGGPRHEGPGPAADRLHQPAPRHRGGPRRRDHHRDRRLCRLQPAAALGLRAVGVGRRHAMGSPPAEPDVRIPHPLRRLRRHRLLSGLGHLHRAVLPLHRLRRLGGQHHPRLRDREPLGAPARHHPRRYPGPERADLRPGATCSASS